MKSLFDYVCEQVVSPEEKQRKKDHKIIKDFIKTNYRAKKLDISEIPDENGKYVVTALKGECTYVGSDTTLEHELFTWGDLGSTASFVISKEAKNLKSLVGGPTSVGWNYTIEGGKLESLEGVSKFIGRKLTIKGVNVDSLTGAEDSEIKDIEITESPIESLEGLPSKVSSLKLYDCKDIKDLKGCPQNISGDLVLRGLDSLVSLKGAPSRVGGDFVLRECQNIEAEDVVISAKEKYLIANPKLVSASKLEKQAKDAEKLNMEYSYKFDGKAVGSLSENEFAINLGFEDMDDLLHSKHPVLKQYVGYTHTKSWGARIYGSDTVARYSGYKIITTPTLSGWDRANDASKEVEDAGYKSSSSKTKSGAGRQTKVYIVKFADAVETLNLMQKRYGGGSIEFVPAE